MTELLMSGFDRTYLPPRTVRRAEMPEGSLSQKIVGGSCTAWDLLAVDVQHPAAQWATTTVDSILASITHEAKDTLGCTDCEDTGFYGLTADGNDDLLTGLLRRVGEGEYESLQADGIWTEWEGTNDGAELLTLELAEDVASAITAGAVGLLRKHSYPLAFLPPGGSVIASPLADYAETGMFAVVDDDDPGAVMQLVRVDEDLITEFTAGGWVPWEVPDSQILAVPLDEAGFEDVQRQMATDLLASGSFGKPGKCKYCAEPATKDIRHSEGMAYIPVCDEHLEKGKEDAAACVPYGNPDPSNIDGIVDKPVAAAGLTADAPLTVSPNPKAERLRRYWSTGRGGAKIRWTAPGSGDFMRCYRHLRKYMGIRAKGYCANLHKRNTGVWPGDRRNTGRRGSASIESDLVASLQSGLWTGEPGRNSDMSVAELKDGIYCEVDDNVTALMQTITAGGFPVSPPDDWYDNPNFTGPTPMQVEDDGRVFGHIATFDVTHIGMAGAVHAPKSKSNYAYFLTGALKTASGKQVNVGQLTLSGGHAPLHADAGAAVKHYDDTNSAVADVTVGEDAYGIWAAGSLRPNITPEQVRVFRASPLSGDWRPINGNLELVAACAVNVPGFPTARARVAGGAILALVAAGARPLALRRASMTADAAVLERLDNLEARIPAEAEVEELPVLNATDPVTVTIPDNPSSASAEVEVIDTPAEVPAATAEVAVDESSAAVEPETVAASTAVAEAPVLEEQVEEAVAAAEQNTPEEVQPEPTDKLDPEQVAQAREEARAIRREWLRKSVHGDGVTAALPPQFIKKAEEKEDSIKDEASLKAAIKSAKPFDRSRIKAAAAKLKLSNLIPKDW